MSPVDDFPLDLTAAVARDQRRHDLLSPLTVISGRAQLVARMIRRSSSLTDPEREAMLNHLGIVEATTRDLAGRIDALDRQSPDGCVRDEALGAPDVGLRDR